MRVAFTPVFDFDDAVSVGYIALMGCANRFDASAGTLFKTFAKSRIVGAVKDEMRSLRWVSRSHVAECKRLKKDPWKCLPRMVSIYEPGNDEDPIDVCHPNDHGDTVTKPIELQDCIDFVRRHVKKIGKKKLRVIDIIYATGRGVAAARQLGVTSSAVSHTKREVTDLFRRIGCSSCDTFGVR